MITKLFDYFETLAGCEGTRAPWAARAPRRPRPDYDLKLLPRSPQWQQDEEALEALTRIDAQPWVDFVKRDTDAVRLRIDNDWIETTGGALEAGGSAEATLGDLAHGQRFSVQFWDANATKALHVGHLRNLAIGNALSAALAQAGAQVERRSLISDMGRAMGEAMAGVMSSGNGHPAWPGENEKSDHFVGACYAEYVASQGATNGQALEYPEDSLSRELTLRDDPADEVLRRVLGGEREALELWYKTRAWVIAGQRSTLARLGVAFDRVFFESDFISDATEMLARGLQEGKLTRREDGVVYYATSVEDFEEFPLVRADGLATQHMRSLAYWSAAPDLEQTVSMQVCGTEWVSHVTCRRKLMAELSPGLKGSMHPTHDIFNGMVAREKRALASSDGALLIDEFLESLDAEIDGTPALREVRRAHPAPERVAAQVALAYFLPYPVAPRIDFEPEGLLTEQASLGWDLVRARARRGEPSTAGRSPAEDPNYRFAVVQSELYRRYLRLAVERRDVRPLAHFLKHLSLWHLEDRPEEHVTRIVHTLLDRSSRGLGLEPAL
jgi:hypothetical protein